MTPIYPFFPSNKRPSSLTSPPQNQGFTLQLQPQTGRSLQPHQKFGVTQAMQVVHAGADAGKKVESIKLRWRVAYTLGSEAKTEMGEIPEFAIA